MKVLILILFLIFMSNSFASSVHGVLMVVKGEVHVTSQKDMKTQKAKIGFKIFPGDTIETKKDSRAKLVMVDKNIINISPDSKFQLEQYEYNEDEGKKSALINVVYGKVRATVTQKYDGQKNKFQIKTKSTVAGVRGTDFVVGFGRVTNVSKVVTFSGLVEVGSGLDSYGNIQDAVLVRPGEFTVAGAGGAPTPPASIPQEEFQEMERQTMSDGDAKNPTESPGSNSEESGESRQPASEEASGSQSASQDILSEMGEDVSAEAVTASAVEPPSEILPPTGNSSSEECPGGQCVPLSTIDPSLLTGNSKVLIRINP